MNLFPLKLNAVEQYMLADDSVDYPRCFTIALQLACSLDETRLREAIDIVTQRHPLLRALVEYEGHRPQRWVDCPHPSYPIDWCFGASESPGDNNSVVSSLDLRRQPGLHFRINRDEGGETLSIQFHHACTDGLGAIQFISDLLLAYRNGGEHVKAALPNYDVSRLARRDSFGMTGWRRPIRWLYGSFGWLAAIEYLAHRPAMLGDPSAERPTAGQPGSACCTRFLTRRESEQIFSAAKQASVTVNDLLLKDVFLAIQEFVECHRPTRTQHHKRVMVPVSLRASGDEHLPAANVVAMINVDRRPGRWADQKRMLKVLHWELTTVKRLRLGLVFVQILHTLHTLFGSLRPFLSRDRCQATCVLSNLGPVFAGFGPETIRAVEFFPPIRPKTSAAFGVVTYEGRIMLSLHYDANALSSDQGTELLDRFVSRLLQNGRPVAAEEPAVVRC